MMKWLFVFVLLVNCALASYSPLQGSCEIVTVLYSDDFQVGVRTLGASLDKVGSSLPRTVLVTSDVSPSTISKLELNGWSTEVVEAHENPHSHEPGARSRLNKVFTKLEVWGRTHTKHKVPLRRVIYLDGDTLVTDQIDELCECEARICAVTRDVYFNAGVMVITPSAHLMSVMLDSYENVPSYNQGEQGFLNRVFPEFQRCPYYDPRDPRDPRMRKDGDELPQCKRIPPFYNGDIGLYVLRGNRWEIDPGMIRKVPKIIHYTLGPLKPWHFYAYALGQPAMWEWYLCYAHAYASEMFWMGILNIVVLSPFIFGAFMAFTCSDKMQASAIPIIRDRRTSYSLTALVVSLLGGWVTASATPFSHPYVCMLTLYVAFFCMMVIFFVAPLVPKSQQVPFLRALFLLIVAMAILLAAEFIPAFSKPIFITLELGALWFYLIPCALSEPSHPDSKFIL